MNPKEQQIEIIEQIIEELKTEVSNLKKQPDTAPILKKGSLYKRNGQTYILLIADYLEIQEDMLCLFNLDTLTRYANPLNKERMAVLLASEFQYVGYAKSILPLPR